MYAKGLPQVALLETKKELAECDIECSRIAPIARILSLIQRALAPRR